MADEEKRLEQLSKDELKELKGGIPYEKPDLIELSGVSQTCAVGQLCDEGLGGDCGNGTTCSTGTIGPDPNIRPN